MTNPKIRCTLCGEAADSMNGCPTHGPAAPLVDIAGHDMNWLWELTGGEAGYLKGWSLIQEMIGIEAVSTDMESGDVFYGYRPYPIGKFGALVLAATKATDAANFLEVGCGPGTKLVLTMKLFKLASAGIDVDAGYIAAAEDLLRNRHEPGDSVWNVKMEDAEDYDNYGEFDIIFLNRPLRDYDREVQLEQHVMNSMKDDAVLILGNGLTQPVSYGWKPIAQEVMCVAFQKQCRCADIEKILQDSGEFTHLVYCKLCGREITLVD